MLIEFNDGTPSVDVKVIATAESVYIVKDKDNLYYIINRDKVKKNKPDSDE